MTDTIKKEVQKIKEHYEVYGNHGEIAHQGLQNLVRFIATNHPAFEIPSIPSMSVKLSGGETVTISMDDLKRFRLGDIRKNSNGRFATMIDAATVRYMISLKQVYYDIGEYVDEGTMRYTKFPPFNKLYQLVTMLIEFSMLEKEHTDYIDLTYEHAQALNKKLHDLSRAYRWTRKILGLK